MNVIHAAKLRQTLSNATPVRVAFHFFIFSFPKLAIYEKKLPILPSTRICFRPFPPTAAPALDLWATTAVPMRDLRAMR